MSRTAVDKLQGLLGCSEQTQKSSGLLLLFSTSNMGPLSALWTNMSTKHLAFKGQEPGPQGSKALDESYES